MMTPDEYRAERVLARREDFMYTLEQLRHCGYRGRIVFHVGCSEMEIKDCSMIQLYAKNNGKGFIKVDYTISVYNLIGKSLREVCYSADFYTHYLQIEVVPIDIKQINIDTRTKTIRVLSEQKECCVTVSRHGWDVVY